MLKDISELEIGCVYQYKDETFDILGIFDRIETNKFNEKCYHFKTISSVEHKWKHNEFVQRDDTVLYFLTKLS